MEVQVEIWLLGWLQMESSYHNTSITPLIYFSEEVGHCQKGHCIFQNNSIYQINIHEKKFPNAPHDF
jgi:hypothetical protein